MAICWSEAQGRRGAPAPRARGLACAIIAGLLATAASCHAARFSAELPRGLPDLSLWEKSTGAAEFARPLGKLEYELYVNPLRPGVYSVARYRVTLSDAARNPAAAPESGHEKLQWDADGKDVRRFECVPLRKGQPACRWRELSRGSAEYDRELSALLSVYSLHAKLLQHRDALGGG